MVKKVYRVENLDCANCASKVEAALNALPEVQEAVLTYATMQLRITAEDPDALLPKLQEAAQKVEPEVEFYPRDGAHTHHSNTGEHEHHHDCCCGHEHHHDHDHEHEHCHDHAHDHHHDDDHEHEHEHHHNHEHTHEHGGEESKDLKPILVGAVLFVVGLVLDHFGLKWPTLGVCLAAYVLLGKEVVVTAVKNLARGQMLDENFLMALASIGAFFTGSFTEAVGVMLFYRVGEYFEDRAVARSRSQIMEAVDLRPEVVQLVDGEAVREIPAGEAKIGDVVLVRPGDRIPLDGIVVSGSSRVDTAPITGEPVPISVAEGDSVVSGCVNTTGRLTVRVEKSLSEIHGHPHSGQRGKCRCQQAQDRPLHHPFCTGLHPHRSGCRRADGDHSLPHHRRLGQMGLHRSDISGHELPLRAGSQRAAGLLRRYRRGQQARHPV